MTTTTAQPAPAGPKLSEAGRLASLRSGDWFGPLRTGRKPQMCRLCGETIAPDEGRIRWSGVERGEGYWTSHAHPECMEVTRKWDHGDWECHSPGDMDRPND